MPAPVHPSVPCALAGAVTLVLASAPSSANVGVDTSALTNALTVEGILRHMQEFQDFADAGDGTREASSDGYIDSALYVSRLMTQAGYDVDVQIFPYTYFENVTPPVLEVVDGDAPIPDADAADDSDDTDTDTDEPGEPDEIDPATGGTDTGEDPDEPGPSAAAFEADGPEGFSTATYSGSGDVTANVTPVDVQLPPGAEANSSTSGCEAEDFEGFPEGDIALVQRGTCTFGTKAANAEAAGASGVIIFNEGQEGRTEAFGGTLGEPGFTVPIVTAAFSIGEALAVEGTTVRLKVDSLTENRISANVLADSPVGRADRTLVVGAHLDSVAEGPGIQDNGSGSAANLEIALQLAELGYLDGGDAALNNRVRFAWWGAEELGLLGSEYYVATLEEEEFDEIAVNLNFDMIGSPNYVRFVYDGDGSLDVAEGVEDVGGPEGSAFIEYVFTDWFESLGLPNEPTAFDGRSDYGPFIAAGIPAGGLFSGAEVIKTEEQAAIYGGEAGVAYDACYHEACDTIDNVNEQSLDELGDAAANAVLVFATNALPEPDAAKRTRAKIAAAGLDAAERSVVMDWRGNHLVR